MTQEPKQWLSAAMDDQQEAAKLASFDFTSEDAATWQRYHLIGDLMRQEADSLGKLDISAEIAQALEHEPTVLAPKNGHLMASLTAKVVPLFKQAGHYAIAATVAAIAVLNLSPEDTQQQANLPVLQTSPIAGMAAPVSLQTQQPNQQLLEQQAQQQKINAYLQDHLLQQRVSHQPQQ
ncbi:sigma-E factor negative regulatory protein [Paraferrimonas sp. SM1919]|uniref:sigma-E factor negative regulatory protein n=1 Tax=Paraferrimonas sp. SM1919 TaxID=2662263 RepID=UPI0013D065C4|nr:RseA family anti-sigma factor [Paraferrimonas sp. SM1919]